MTSTETRITEIEDQIKVILSQQRSIQHDVNSMRQELKNYSILSSERDARVERLIYLLEGDRADLDRGIIARVKNIETFISSIKDMKSYLSGNIAASIAIISFLGLIAGGLIKLYQLLKGQ